MALDSLTVKRHRGGDVERGGAIKAPSSALRVDELHFERPCNAALIVTLWSDETPTRPTTTATSADELPASQVTARKEIPSYRMSGIENFKTFGESLFELIRETGWGKGDGRPS